MLQKLLILVGYLVLVVFFIVTLAFTSNESKNVSCRNIEIEFRDNDIIKLDKNELIRLVKSADKNLMGKRLSEVNTELIEKEVEKHQAILKSEVYKVVAKDSISYKGILAVKVKHRDPAVRIMSASGSYYLDENGGKIPVSANYTADILVVTGHFTERFAKQQLLPFILFIKNNEFWKAQIEQVHIEKNGDVTLVPLVGDHLIEFGKLDNYQAKLRNMKAFYSQVLAKNNWNKYKTLSLKYNNQIVAKRR